MNHLMSKLVDVFPLTSLMTRAKRDDLYIGSTGSGVKKLSISELGKKAERRYRRMNQGSTKWMLIVRVSSILTLMLTSILSWWCVNITNRVMDLDKKVAVHDSQYGEIMLNIRYIRDRFDKNDEWTRSRFKYPL